MKITIAICLLIVPAVIAVGWFCVPHYVWLGSAYRLCGILHISPGRDKRAVPPNGRPPIVVKDGKVIYRAPGWEDVPVTVTRVHGHTETRIGK